MVKIMNKRFSLLILLIFCALFLFSCGEKTSAVYFFTEYKVEKYCGNRFIVSKPDCMFYGVLDIEGKEIIPVIYDEIRLLHEKDRTAGLTDAQYFKAKYKNTYIIFDYDGNIVCFLGS